MNSTDADKAREDLASFITNLLSASLGGLFTLHSSLAKVVSLSATQFAMVSGTLYLVIFALPLWSLTPNSSHDLAIFSIWGAAYFCVAVALARTTSADVLDIVRFRILPLMSGEAVSQVTSRLRKRYLPLRVHATSLVAAAVATALTVFVLCHDLYPDGPPRMGVLLILYFSLGYMILYLTAARATDIARFYDVFAESLHIDLERIYPQDPARSALVLAVSAVGHRVIQFWIGILIAILSLFPVYFLVADRWFILLVVPVSSFFAIGVSAAVLLNSEAMLRRAVARVASRTLADLEGRLSDLHGKAGVPDDAERARWAQLEAMRTHLVEEGQYRTLRLGLLTLAAPFVGPIVSAVALILRDLPPKP